VFNGGGIYPFNFSSRTRQANYVDKNDYWLPNMGAGSQIPGSKNSGDNDN